MSSGLKKEESMTSKVKSTIKDLESKIKELESTIINLESKIKERDSTIQELESNISELENVLLNPSQYREAWALNSDKDLFEILKEELVDYLKKNPDFEKSIVKVSKRNISPLRSSKSVGSIVSPAIFSPRRSTTSYLRESSRPILR